MIVPDGGLEAPLHARPDHNGKNAAAAAGGDGGAAAIVSAYIAFIESDDHQAVAARLEFRTRQDGRQVRLQPGVGHRQFGAGNEFRIRIGVDQGLQRDTRHVEAVMLHRIHGPVK